MPTIGMLFLNVSIIVDIKGWPSWIGDWTFYAIILYMNNRRDDVP